MKKAGLISKMQVNSIFNDYDICVVGSYATGNIGDQAIGLSIVRNLRNNGINTDYFSRNVRLFNHSKRILGGGGLIHDRRERKLRRDLKLMTDESMIIGIGVNPVNDKELRDLIKKKINNIALVTVRDEKSKRILENIVGKKIPSLACPAFLLDIPDRSGDAYTGLSLRPLPLTEKMSERERKYMAQTHLNYDIEQGLNNIEDLYQSNIETINRKISDLKHIPFHHTDTKFIKGLDRIDIDRFRYIYDVDRTLQRVADSSRMICMRYHSLVFSILANKPTIAIAYSPKVAELAERAGIPWYKPYDTIKFNFKKPSNRNEIISDAWRNIELILEHLDAN